MEEVSLAKLITLISSATVSMIVVVLTVIVLSAFAAALMKQRHNRWMANNTLKEEINHDDVSIESGA